MNSSIPRHHIIISGTGRAGTTFLVRLLTDLGADTGFTPENWKRSFHSHCSAGLEKDLRDENAPYIVKSPALSLELSQILETGKVVIDHAFVPIRSLEDATASRLRIGGSNNNIPGGVWGTHDPASQKAVLAESFHHLIHTLTTREIPCTFLDFPRFARDEDYAWKQLRPALPLISRNQFKVAFARVADPSLIHQFQPGAHVQAPEARAFQRRRNRRRLLRWLAPTVALLTLATGFLLMPA